ncbi:release factor glutamine methyltransferase [Streptomyces sp. LamerLS-316]|uniref:HemK2/MTQ2 family protein methyltransferase n=1 Tax=unclassified Streptomyces TaxID=2593676 RepID=UPI000823941C|nr:MULTISPECIES: HemK2/MTQ2 family protein methyltransferase [unclassified Streptomyces]MYQ39748.1 methyltransferase [Streptomyces sp. SID4921]SCK18147.1 release factor glutamine methyltransferase [Streptomyces sp. LamerLS-316]
MSADVAEGTPTARMMTLPGVYAPQHDTRLLMAALNREEIGPGTEVLDVGTGSGALALHASRLGARVTAVDVARRAVATARLNALLHRRRITVRRSDLLAALPGRSYDLVICNPPYVPSPLGRLPGHGAARAWEAGRDGRAILDRVCETAPAALRPGGRLLLVHSGLCDSEVTLRRLSDAGLQARVSDRALVPLGPVLRSRLRWLRETGLVDDGATAEELVVIRAEHA